MLVSIGDKQYLILRKENLSADQLVELCREVGVLLEWGWGQEQHPLLSDGLW